MQTSGGGGTSLLRKPLSRLMGSLTPWQDLPTELSWRAPCLTLCCDPRTGRLPEEVPAYWTDPSPGSWTHSRTRAVLPGAWVPAQQAH